MNQDKVYLSRCESYLDEDLKKSINEILITPGLLDFVKPGMKIAIKANLVAGIKPSLAATTHPSLVKVVALELVKRGATVIVGDSPGGLFTEGVLKSIYKETEMTKVVSDNITLNSNFNTFKQTTSGIVIKEIDGSSWLKECDAIINICKLKSHGMMGLSCAVKNMFGSVPGILKPEYHYRYPSHDDFAKMLIDLYEYYHPVISIVDGILAMEGNGPTKGHPRLMNILMASTNPYNIDLIATKLIGLDYRVVPTVRVSVELGLGSTDVFLDNSSLVNRSFEEFILPDFLNTLPQSNMEFKKLMGPFSFVANKIAKSVLKVKPAVIKKKCIGCKKCASICPAKAIIMKDNKPIINRSDCIRCFCCQEFCPVGAMIAKKNPIVKMLSK